MSHKKPDHYGRLRTKIVAFRVSSYENDLINEAVLLSGLCKQDYIIRKLTDREVIVQPSSRTFKALKDTMNNILTELKRIENSSDCTEIFLESVRYVSSIYARNNDDTGK